MADERPYRISDETLRHLNRHAMVGQFVSGVAHELNNPLQVVAGLVELLQDRTDLPADVQTKLDKIGTHATRASQTIRNLLSFARDARTESARVDVKRLIDHGLSLRSYQQARMRITTTPDLPAEGVCLVMGSAQQIEQLVLNLVINAEQALARTPEGTERRIGIRLWKEAGTVKLLVHDNGAAIGPAEREQVFAPFYSTLPAEEGIGLGVPVSAVIAAAHGGRLSLESAAAGTAFLAELPEAG